MPGIKPWHLWGGDAAFDIGGDSPASIQGTTQIARVNYGRPETWRFLAFAQLDALPNPPAPQANAPLVVIYNLTIGVGRTVLQLPAVILGFGQGSTTLAQGQVAYGQVIPSQGQLVQAQDGSAIAAVSSNSETFVASDIQVNVTAEWLIIPAPSARVRCSVLFAPNVHVRPEWFERRFPGDEQIGH